MKYVLVTGAAGFIGSNMVEHLLKNTDFFVIGVDNFLAGTKIYDSFLKKFNSNDRFRFIESDFCDLEEYVWLKKIKIDYVFHFAATPMVSYSVEFPIETNNNNVSKTLALLEWCKNKKVKKFIFSSSSAVYGDVSVFPTHESENKNPKSPYALQKLIIEEYCKLYSSLYNLDTVCLRYFNVYGKNQYSENAYSNVICSWLKGLLTNTAIRLDGDGFQSRDFVYVTDVCEANLLAALRKEEFNGRALNVASGENYSLNEILSLFKNEFGIKFKIKNAKPRAGDVLKTLASIKEIEKIGYKSKIKFKKGLKSTIDWYKKSITFQ